MSCTRSHICRVALLLAAGAGWAAAGEVSPVTEASISKFRTEHWAIQPLSRPPLPSVSDPSWPRGPVDRLILARLEGARLAPSPAADRRVLARRLWLDLLGVPPTFQQVEAFAAQTGPEAVARLADRLLAHPAHGQRWARHWLDVARYADTKGYVFTEERRYAYAWTYRDYVVGAFNSDKPYDRFILEQIAADRLGLGENDPALAAMGFLTVGRRFGNNINDIIDDRLDVVGRGLMGLTITCARCHDHKYDPIPTADYYALHGVFSGSEEPREYPLIAAAMQTAEYEAFEKELKNRQQAVDDDAKNALEVIIQELRSRPGDYLLYIAQTLPGHQEGSVLMRSQRGELRPEAVKRWMQHLVSKSSDQDPLWGPWHSLARLPRQDFAAAAQRVISGLGDQVNPLLREALKSGPPASMADVAQRYGRLLEEAYAQRETPQAQDPGRKELLEVLLASGAPASPSKEDLKKISNRAERDQFQKLRREMESFQANSPVAPPRAMVLVDESRPPEARIFLRGDPEKPGPVVPKRFLKVLDFVAPAPLTEGSGRLGLARAVASPENPFTARVIVNRVWGWHFGTHLVATPSDFGTRGEKPTHPQLLDRLATDLIRSGWSLKRLHRQIVLSQTWAQSSADRSDPLAVDPANRLYWKGVRGRMEFEVLRDSILSSAGRLDGRIGGRSADLFSQPYTQRRAIYGFLDRQDLPGLLRIFDFPSPDVHTPQRPSTMVPQQGLFFLNSPFVAQQAQALAARSEAAVAQPDDRVRTIYRLVLSRLPEEAELALGLAYIQEAVAAGEPQPWARYAQALLMSNEFLFVD